LGKRRYEEIYQEQVAAFDAEQKKGMERVLSQQGGGGGGGAGGGTGLERLGLIAKIAAEAAQKDVSDSGEVEPSSKRQKSYDGSVLLNELS